MSTSSPPRRVYSFGDFTLDLERGMLERRGADVRLRRKSFEVLCYLVENRRRVVSREELLNAVWGRTIVSDGSVTQCLIDIRRTLGDDSQSLIRTVPRRGYIFDAPVSCTPNVPSGASCDAASTTQEVAVPSRTPRRSLDRLVVACTFLCLALAWPVTQMRVTPREEPRGPSMAFGDSETFSLYQQGRYFHDRRAPGDLDRAARRYEHVLARDPCHALAWSGLAAVYRVQAAEVGMSPEIGAAKRRFAVEQALRCNPGLAEVQVEAATLAWDNGDTGSAEAHRRAALVLQPDNPRVLIQSANAAAWSDQIDDAIAFARRVVAVEPLAAIPRNQLANLLLAAGQFENARTEFVEQSELNPAMAAETDVAIGFIWILEHRFDRALALVDRWPAGDDKDEAMAMIGEAVGREAEGAAAMRRLRALQRLDGDVRLAEVHAFRGNSDGAFDALAAAHARITPATWSSPDGLWTWQMRFSPFLRPLHDDPRWELVHRSRPEKVRRQ